MEKLKIVSLLLLIVYIFGMGYWVYWERCHKDYIINVTISQEDLIPVSSDNTDFKGTPMY